jgi:nitroreductase/NAD-dependent dihydropyrimidine dehydrogenase PreA subunit
MGIMTSHGETPGLPVVDAETCSHCGLCVEACPVGVLSLGSERIEVDTSTGFGCIACAHCAMVCPSESITVTGRDLVADDLEPLPERAQPSMEQLEALFRTRRSIRTFKPDPVPGELLERIITAASRAPMGIPPWEVGVVAYRSRERVRELAQDTAKAYGTLLAFMDRAPVRFLMRLFMKKAVFRRMDGFLLPLGREIVGAQARGEDKVLYDAPAALLFSHSPHADAADAVIACTYAMLAAEALGLGSCMIGCLPPVLARRKDLMAKHGIPAGQTPALVLILGYPATTFLRGVRRRFLTITGR